MPVGKLPLPMHTQSFYSPLYFYSWVTNRKYIFPNSNHESSVIIENLLLVFSQIDESTPTKDIAHAHNCFILTCVLGDKQQALTAQKCYVSPPGSLQTSPFVMNWPCSGDTQVISLSLSLSLSLPLSLLFSLFGLNTTTSLRTRSGSRLVHGSVVRESGWLPKAVDTQTTKYTQVSFTLTGVD